MDFYAYPQPAAMYASACQWLPLITDVHRCFDSFWLWLSSAAIASHVYFLALLNSKAFPLIIPIIATIGCVLLFCAKPGLFRIFVKKLYRRLSLRWMGYRRPPLMLCFMQRKRFCFFRFMMAEAGVGSNAGWRFGFYSRIGIKEPDKTETEKEKNSFYPNDEWSLYLWPDHLRWDYWLYAIVVSIPLFPVAALPALTSLAAIAVFTPVLVYRVFRLPVLEGLNRRPCGWPVSVQTYLRQYLPLKPGSTPESNIATERSNPPWKKKACKLFKGCREYIYANIEYILPCIFEKWDTVNQCPNESPQKSLIKFAVAELFQKNPDADNAVWLDRGFWRWIFYWCAPCWSSYAVLLLLLAFYGKCFKVQLVVAVILWLVVSFKFLLSEFAEFRCYSQLNHRDKRMLLPALHNLLATPSVVVNLDDDKIKTVIAWISAGCITFYLGVLGLILKIT